MRKLSMLLAAASMLAFLALVPGGASSSGQRQLLSLRVAPELPLASVALRYPEGHLRARAAGQLSPCDKTLDLTGSLSGVAPVAAQDNVICTSADIDVYRQGGQTYVAQAGGEEAAFTITRLNADGSPQLITQVGWVQANTYTPDVKAFRKGDRSYIALALERIQVNGACGVVIVDVTDAPAVSVVAQIIGSAPPSGGPWCDVHNVFVEKDATGEGLYIYLTADSPRDLRVLDIGSLSGISEVGRYTHPDAGGENYVHDVTVIDHGGAGRRAYVSYWDAGLMVLNAAHVTPGVVESGSANQPLNPNHSIDPAGFLVHHAYPSADGARVFIQDEFLTGPGDEPVQMWDIADPSAPQYVAGVTMGSALMPVTNPAHNLHVEGGRLYVGWYRAGLQAFDFTPAGFVSRPMYHQVQTQVTDDANDGAWGVRLATIGSKTYLLQSDRRYGLIVDAPLDFDGDGVSDASDNCPSWPNPSQAVPSWNRPPGDGDCDGFSAGREQSSGTDPNLNCPRTAGADDEAVDAWPVDVNDDRRGDLVDVLRYIPHFNTDVPPGPARFDINQDARVGLADLLSFIPFFNMTCTP